VLTCQYYCCGFYQNCEKARHVQRQIKDGILYCFLQKKENIQDRKDLMKGVRYKKE